MDGAEERTAVVLQANKWLWLCDGCLALKVGVGLPAMQEVMTTLARFRGYRVGKHRCSVCQRRKRVIRAVADNPPREGQETQRNKPKPPTGQPRHTDIAATIRAKITARTLPRVMPSQVWAGYGTGQPCDGCGQEILDTGIEYEVEIPDWGRIRFHLTCLAIWHHERVKLQAER